MTGADVCKIYLRFYKLWKNLYKLLAVIQILSIRIFSKKVTATKNENRREQMFEIYIEDISNFENDAFCYSNPQYENFLQESNSNKQFKKTD
jgi:hypothetical protein